MSPPDIITQSDQPVADIDVCVCTYRRGSVLSTLYSLAQQTLIQSGLELRVIVADNDVIPSAKVLVEEAAARWNINVTYLHAPRENISIARNACLDAVTAPWIAFIDDDEVASPDWLLELFREARSSDTRIVLGPAVAQYPQGAANWIYKADLHSTSPARRKGGEIDTGYSCNVLLETKLVGKTRFSESLGKSGGEDDLFFSRLHRNGNVISFAEKAVVFDVIPIGRAQMRWLAKRAFRNGQTFAMIRRLDKSSTMSLLVSAGAKLGFSAVAAILHFGSSVKWRKWLFRGALHAGVISNILGAQTLQLYNSKEDAA